LINIGDKALTAGLYHIIGDDNTTNILTGVWKPFPYFTYDRLQHALETQDIQTVFSRWHAQLASISPARLAIEYVFLFFFFVIRNIFYPIEYYFIKKCSRGVFETIEPYFIRGIMFRRVMRKIQKADAVLFNGAGLIADHIRKYVPGYLFECYCALQQKKPIASVNQSMPIQDETLRTAVLYIYSRMYRHFVREPQAKENLASMGIDASTIDVVPDAAFFAHVNRPALHNTREKNRIALLIRGDRKCEFDALESMVKALQKNGNTVTFVHTCSAHDKAVVRELNIRKCRIEEIVNDSYEEVINALREFGIVITDRYHGAIFALRAGSPFIPLKSVTSKMDGLCDLCDTQTSALDISQHNAWKQVVDEVARIQSQYRFIQNAVVDKMSEIKSVPSQKYVSLVNDMVKIS
jgi:polysaccharide pyruvyl transferase WcaK-like protein